MMMQMLEAGGLETITDGKRPPDDFNPRGYYEHDFDELVKCGIFTTPHDVVRAVKVTVPRLSRISFQVPVKIIFMLREIRDVLRSQDRMFLPEGEASPDAHLAHRAAIWENIVSASLMDVSTRPGVEVMEVWYEHVLTQPMLWSQLIRAFLDTDLDVKKMVEVVRPGLCHFFSSS